MIVTCPKWQINDKTSLEPGVIAFLDMKKNADSKHSYRGPKPSILLALTAPVVAINKNGEGGIWRDIQCKNLCQIKRGWSRMRSPIRSIEARAKNNQWLLTTGVLMESMLLLAEDKRTRKGARDRVRDGGTWCAVVTPEREQPNEQELLHWLHFSDPETTSVLQILYFFDLK